MKKIIHETRDFLSFESPEWKKISHNPAIYEAHRNNIIVKCREYKIDGNIGTQVFRRLVFNKGEKVTVSIVDDKYRLEYDNRKPPSGQTSHMEMWELPNFDDYV